MSKEIIVASFDEAERLVTANYWVDEFFFANTDQGETSEQNFNRAYQITDRNETAMVHYSKIS